MSYRLQATATSPFFRSAPRGLALLSLVVLSIFLVMLALPCAPASAIDSGYPGHLGFQSGYSGGPESGQLPPDAIRAIMQARAGHEAHYYFEGRYYPGPGWLSAFEGGPNSAGVSGQGLAPEAVRTISGKVTGAGGVPLQYVVLYAFDSSGGGTVHYAETAADGTYTFTGLAPGSYLIRTWNSGNYIDEWYNNVVCQANDSATGATLVNVSAANATGKNFQLALGSSISGTITDGGGTPLENVGLEVLDLEGNYISRDASTAADGTYTLGGLLPGSYKIRTYSLQNYINEWYGNVLYQGNPQGIGATIIDIAASDATGIDFQLALGHSISGRVTKPGSVAFPEVEVRVYDQLGNDTGVATWTYADGTYIVSGLIPGLYKLATYHWQNYVDEWYDNVPRQSDVPGDTATLIDIRTTDAAGKNFQLDPGRRISGKVTNSGGAALQGVFVIAHDQLGNWIERYTWTAADGTFTIQGLLPGSYKLSTSNDQGYIDEWYNNIVAQGNWDGTGAALVNIASADATGKNFQLALGRTISGKITKPGGAGLGGAEVDVTNNLGNSINYAWTASDGTYSVKGLAPGSYLLSTYNDQGFVDEWYGPGHPVTLGNNDAIGAAAVNVSSANASGINVDLLAGFTISGHVVEDVLSGPLQGGLYSHVEFFAADGTLLMTAWMSPGETAYQSLAFPPGVYYARTVNPSGYKDEWYQDLQCDTYELADADPINITSTSATGVDFSLTLPPPTVFELDRAFGSTAGGEDVVVFGNAFIGVTGSSAVTFDGIDALSYSVDTPWQITATAPPHAAGTVQVEVTGSGGTSADTPDDDYTYMPPVTRAAIRGSDRYDTAIRVSQAVFPGALPAGAGLVLAPGETFPEALCGAPLAAAYGGPVLLTYQTALANNVKAELQRLAPTHVFCIGLSTATVTAVQTALPTAVVTAINGVGAAANIVYDMSRKVANALETKVGDMTGATGIITRGDMFPDAIGVSPLACAKLWPIILTNSGGATLHASAAVTLADLGITQTLKVGSYATMPAGVTALANLSGADRYATNANVANWAENNAGLLFAHIGIATGDKFPDALASGPYLAKDDGILLLSPLAGPLPPVIGGVITANKAAVERVTFIAMIEPVVGQVKALLP